MQGPVAHSLEQSVEYQRDKDLEVCRDGAAVIAFFSFLSNNTGATYSTRDLVSTSLKADTHLYLTESLVRLHSTFRVRVKKQTSRDRVQLCTWDCPGREGSSV